MLQKAASLASEPRVSHAGCHSLSVRHTGLNTTAGHSGVGTKHHGSEAVTFKSVTMCFLANRHDVASPPTGRHVLCF